MSIALSLTIVLLHGLCIRDSTGQLVLGLSNFNLSSSSPAEALGLLEAVKFSIDRGMNSVIFESDSKIVIDVRIYWQLAMDML